MPRRRSPAALLSAHLTHLARTLHPEPERLKLARERADNIIDELHRGPAWMFEVKAVHEHGSHARSTALRGFSDLDLLVELNPHALRTVRDEERTPEDTLRRMARAINDRWAGLKAMGFVKARPQGHSVGVIYPRSNLRIDLVPVLRRRTKMLIPSVREGDWIQTFPGRAAARLEQAKVQLPHVAEAVRLLKGWRRARGSAVAIPSYALEILLVDRALEQGGSLFELIYGFLGEVADCDMRYRLELRGNLANPPPMLVTDPDTEVNVTEKLTATHRRNLIDRCRWTRDALDEVLQRLAVDPDARVGSALDRLFVGNH